MRVNDLLEIGRMDVWIVYSGFSLGFFSFGFCSETFFCQWLPAVKTVTKAEKLWKVKPNQNEEARKQSGITKKLIK